MDDRYAARRSHTLIVAVNCSHAGGTCFCTSMGTGPGVQDGYDLALTELLGEIDGFLSVVYARPANIDALATSTPTAQHVPVDFELRGCPINKRQLLEVITAFLHDRRPDVRARSVCMACKRQGSRLPAWGR